MPEDSSQSALLEPPKIEAKPAPPRTRSVYMWWWVGFAPVAVIAGALGGLVFRTYHEEIMRAAAAVHIPGSVAVTPAAEGWRWLFSKQEWRRAKDGIGQFSDGLLLFHGTLGRPQPSADAAIRARVVIHGPLPQPASIFMRSTASSGQYRWVLDPAQRNVRLLYEVNGQARELGKYRLAKPLEEGDRVLLELRATGAQITGSINGSEVVRVNDGGSAEAGLWGIAGEGVWFEIVEVWDPNSSKTIAQAEPEESEIPKAPVVAVVPVEPVVAPAVPPVPIPIVSATPAPAMLPSAAPASATPAPNAEITRWLASMDAQWRASYQRDVETLFEKSAVELRRQHVLALGNPLAAATKAARNEEALIWRTERDEVSKGKNPPATDEEATPPALKLLRANFRSQFARIDRERFERASALFAKCDEVLAKSQATLVQRQRADDAATVQKERDQLREAWLQPPATMVASALPRMSIPSATPAKISSQQIVQKLLALGASVWAKRGKADAVAIKAETEVTATERLIFTRVEFRARKPDESPLVTADYAILDSLSEVQELDLAGAAVKDSVMEKLRTFRALKNLSLNQAKPSPASYAVLPTLPELRVLQLRDTDMNDDAMKTVLQCHKLQRLHLNDLPITDVGMADIGKLAALEEIYLGDLDKIASPSFARLAECRALKRVHAGGFLILTGMVENLGKCKNLESLSLPGSKLKDPAVAPLGALPKLKSLDLSGSAVTGAAFAAWPQRHEITSLNLSNAGGVDDAGCKTIEHTFPKLEDLTMELGAKFSTEGANALARLRALRTLRINGTGIDNGIVAELAHGEALTNLSIASAVISEPGAASLARLPKLTDLHLDMPPISDAALKSFSRCKALKTVHIGKDADPDTEQKFLRSVPGVKAIRPDP